MSLHGLRFRWSRGNKTYHLRVLESAGKDLLLVTVWPISSSSCHIHLCIGPGVLLSRASLDYSTCSCEAREGRSFQKRKVWAGRKGREACVVVKRQRGRAQQSPRSSFILPFGKGPWKWPHKVHVKKDCEAFRTEFCRRKLIAHLVFLTLKINTAMLDHSTYFRSWFNSCFWAATWSERTVREVRRSSFFLMQQCWVTLRTCF